MSKYSIFLFSVASKSAILDLGIYNLKAYLKQDESISKKVTVTTRIFRPRVYSHQLDGFVMTVSPHYIQNIVHVIMKQRPNMVGFSCSVKNFEVMLAVAGILKKKSPTTTIVFGGPEIHQELVFSPKKHIQNGPIDIAVLYDGEITFSKAISHIIDEKPLDGIPDIYFKKKGKLYKTPHGIAQPLSLLPSPFLTYAVSKVVIKRQSVIENSRGCPFRCSYCTYPLSHFGTVRYFPLKKTLDEFYYLLRKKVKLLFIVDDNFDIFPQRSIQILKTYLKKNISTQLMVYLNASRQVINNEFIKLLAKSRIIISIGVQSTNKQALKYANRNTNLDTLETNLKNMDKAGVRYRLEFIEGLPGDTFETIKSTVDWLFRFRASHVFFYRLLILKGTSFQQHTKDFGITYNRTPPFMIRKTKTLSPNDLIRTSKLCRTVTAVYNNPETRNLFENTMSQLNISASEILEEISRDITRPNNTSEKRQFELILQKRIMSRYISGMSMK
jgi:anaerobic magnesium-protoporphyrin IX monomethyl ester cyclase